MKSIIIRMIIFSFLIILSPWNDLKKSYVHAETLSFENIVVKDEFQAGIGESVGHFRKTEGYVIVIHKNEEHAYSVKQNLPLYKGDTVIVRDGRAALEIRDGSVISLSPDTNITINQSIYQPDWKHRISFITMTLGKARFWIKKFPDFTRASFKLKTKTAVVGVRGSDFMVEATEDFTSVDTLADTELEIVSLFSRCRKMDNLVECDIQQYKLDEFQHVVVKKDDRILESRPLSPKEKEDIEESFPPVPESGEPLVVEQIIAVESIDTVELPEMERPNLEFISNKVEELKENTVRELPEYPGVPEQTK